MGQPKEKREKQMDYKGLKTGGWVGHIRKKEKTNGLRGAKNRGLGGQP